MRKDVKAGLVLSLVVVAFAGWYYTRDAEKQAAIPLADNETAAPSATLAPTAAPRIASRQSPRSTPSARARNADRHSDRENQVASRTPRKPRRSRVRDNNADRATPAPVTLRAKRTDVETPPVAEPGQATPTPATVNPPFVPPVATDDTGTGDTATGDAVAGAPHTPAETTEAIDLYRVQPGDTFEILAEVYYGNRGYARFLRERNPRLAAADRLPVGAVVKLPPLPEDARILSPAASSPPAKDDTPPAEGERTYTVVRGDSFYAIADRLLGSGPRWEEIFALNRDLVDGDPQNLKPGMVLTIPRK